MVQFSSQGQDVALKAAAGSAVIALRNCNFPATAGEARVFLGDNLLAYGTFVNCSSAAACAGLAGNCALQDEPSHGVTCYTVAPTAAPHAPPLVSVTALPPGVTRHRHPTEGLRVDALHLGVVWALVPHFGFFVAQAVEEVVFFVG